MSESSKFLLFLFIGYAVIWVGIIGYVMYVGARLRAVERDLDSLRTEAGDLPDAQSNSGAEKD
jgi:CcmD family protein